MAAWRNLREKTATAWLNQVRTKMSQLKHGDLINKPLQKTLS